MIPGSLNVWASNEWHILIDMLTAPPHNSLGMVKCCEHAEELFCIIDWAINHGCKWGWSQGKRRHGMMASRLQAAARLTQKPSNFKCDGCVNNAVAHYAIRLNGRTDCISKLARMWTDTVQIVMTTSREVGSKKKNRKSTGHPLLTRAKRLVWQSSRLQPFWAVLGWLMVTPWPNVFESH